MKAQGKSMAHPPESGYGFQLGKEHYEQLLDEIDECAVYQLDASGHVVSCNRSACRLLEHDDDALLGQYFDCLYDPKEREGGRPERHLRRAARYGRYRSECWCRGTQGRRVRVACLLVALRERGGTLGGYWLKLRAVERSSLEAELRREREARLALEAAQHRSQLLERAGEALASSLEYCTTLASVARMVVDSFADYCLVDLVEADGNLRRLAIVHADPACIERAWQLERRFPLERTQNGGAARVARTGRPELAAEVSDAALVAIACDREHLEELRGLGLRSYLAVPMVTRGRTLGVLTLLSTRTGRHYSPADLMLACDLARRAAMAIDSARLYSEAQQANRLKDEFLAVLSHELRTPLNPIIGFSQLLRRGTLGPTATNLALETIERNGRLQAQLIDDLLDVARILQGQFRLEHQEVALPGIVEATVGALRSHAEAKQLTLMTELASDLGTLQADPHRLSQVVWNLVSNAIKFTPHGGHVRVCLTGAPGEAQIVVADTGIGIAPEFLPHIFERFRQADSTSTREYGGLGLGLTIVRHIVEAHGGTIEVASLGVGRGSTFTVRLPLGDCQQKSEP